jgi:hypothetical protein
MEDIRISYYYNMDSPDDPKYILYQKFKDIFNQLTERERQRAVMPSPPAGAIYWSATGDGGRAIIRLKSELEAARAAAFAVEPTPAGTLIIKHRGGSLEYTLLDKTGVIKGIYFCQEPDIGGIIVKFNKHNSTINRLSVLGTEFIPYSAQGQHIYLKEEDARRLYDFYTARLLPNNKAVIRAAQALAARGAEPQLSLASAGGGAGGGGGGGGTRKRKSKKH